MSILCVPGKRWVLLALIMGLAGTAHADCNGPQAMVAKLRAQPTTEDAVQLGNWYASHKQFSCAAETFRNAQKADPDSAQLHYLEGLALLTAGGTTDAIPAMQAAIRLQPDVIKPHLLLAYLYDETEQRGKAEDEWKRALKIDPRSEQALEGLSDDQLAREDYPAVIVLLRNAPRTEKLAINLSQALGKLKYLDDAAKVLNEAMQQSPQSFDLVRAMTVVLVSMHRYEETINLLQATVDKFPDNVDAKVELFRVLVLTNHFDRASKLAPVLLPLRPHDSQVLYLSGMVARAMGENDKAKDLLEQAVSIDPNFFYSRYNLGMVLVLLRDWPEAKDNLEKAIALGVPLPEVHFELAKALKGLGDSDGATKEMVLYQQMKKADENVLEAASAAAQGDKDLADGKIEEATRHYREAAAQAPDNADYKFKLSEALRKAGDQEGERVELEDAVRLDARLAGAQNRLGYLLARAGDANGAVAHLRLAVQSAPAWTDAWVNLAGELAVSGHFQEARQAVEEALDLDPENARARQLSERLTRDPAAKPAANPNATQATPRDPP